MSAADRIGADLSPQHWPVANRLLGAQRLLQRLPGAQPAEFVSDRLAKLKPAPGADLNAAVLSVIQLDVVLQAQLPPLMRDWSDLDNNTTALEKSNDAYVSSFAMMLRRSAGDEIQLGDGGFTGVEVLHTNRELASRLQTVTRGGFPGNIDFRRFSTEVTSRMDLVHPQIADVQKWLERVPFYGKQDEQTANAVADLQAALQRALQKIADLHPEAADQADVDVQRKLIEQNLEAFSRRHFTSRDISDGTFAAEQTRIDSQIAALRSLVHSGGSHSMDCFTPNPRHAIRRDQFVLGRLEACAEDQFLRYAAPTQSVPDIPASDRFPPKSTDGPRRGFPARSPESRCRLGRRREKPP